LIKYLMSSIGKHRLLSVFFIFLLVAGGYFIYQSEQASLELEAKREAGEEVEISGWARWPFQLGLDLRGGAHLVYEADVSGIESATERDQRMRALRALIEQRVDGLGVAEPLVQVERGGVAGEGSYRLIVELPGVSDVDEAIAAIGETPILQFRLLREGQDSLLFQEGETAFDLQPGEEIDLADPTATGTDDVDALTGSDLWPDLDDRYQWTGLDGSMLRSARFEMQQTTREPVVAINFNAEGARLFQSITRENVGRQLAIVLDGQPISEPVIRQEIRGGEAIISGGFTAQEARELAQRLQAGALPVNIELVSTQTVGPTLGEEVMVAGVQAGVVGLIMVAVFLLVWYRLPGLIAIVALSLYLVMMLSLFKLIGVTLTAAGIAGFILSIGMAVDANILIFERMKEELRRGQELTNAIIDGFSRAWLSIRDGNFSSLITAVILYWFGTPLVQGFALVFFIGIMVSMLTAITVTRGLLLALAVRPGRGQELLFGSGIKSASDSGND